MADDWTREVLRFWFEESGPESWYMKSQDFDNAIQERFEPMVISALKGKLRSHRDDAEAMLATILLLDQFTRNIYRDTPEAFSGDELALTLSLQCIQSGRIDHKNPPFRQFMLMPMMHSEDLEVQDRSLPLFEEYTNPRTLDFAVQHRDIIARFGRFPHRNAILGRTSTPEELAFLKLPGSSF